MHAHTHANAYIFTWLDFTDTYIHLTGLHWFAETWNSKNSAYTYPMGMAKKDKNKHKEQLIKLMVEVGMAVQKSTQTRVVG